VGVVRQAVMRAVLHALAIALSLATGIIVARRLSPVHYAAYQMVVKRTSMFAGVLCATMGFWAYRYVAMGLRGALREYLRVVALNSAIALFVALGLGVYMKLGDPRLLALACIAGALTVAFGGMNRVIVAARAVYSELIVAVRRCIYAALIVALTYFAALGVLGAFTAVVLSLIVGIAMQLHSIRHVLAERSERSYLREWAKSIHIPLLMWLATFVASMDALIVAYLGGSYAAAEFFVSVALLSMVMEVATVASMHIAAYTLRTMDVAGGVRVSCLATLIASAICGYAMARPAPLIALMNPLYVSASSALRMYALGLAIRIALAPVWSSIVGSVRDLAASPSRRLLTISAASIATSLLYAGLIPAIALLGRVSPVIAWSLSYIAYAVAGMGAAYVVGGPALRRLVTRKVVPRLALFMSIAYVAAQILAPHGFTKTFFSDALLVLEGLAVTGAIYAPTVLAIDGEMRRLVLEFIKRARRSPLSWV